MNSINCQWFLWFGVSVVQFMGKRQFAVRGKPVPDAAAGAEMPQMEMLPKRALEGIGVFLYNYKDTMVGSVNGLTMP